MLSSKKAYYAIIPADVRYHQNLCPNAKLMYGEITALCNQEGYCWATNRYFSELYDVTTGTASKWISALREEGFIETEDISADAHTIRHIRILGGNPFPSAKKKSAPRGRPRKSTSPELIEKAKEVLVHWNSKPGLIVHRESYIEKGRSSTNKYTKILGDLLETESVESIKDTIDNYNDVVSSPIYFWNYKYTLADFLFRGYEKFKDRQVALGNYLKNGNSRLDAEPEYGTGI